MSSLEEVLEKFDAVLRVRFLTRAEGGRKGVVSPPSGFYSCTLFGEGDTKGYDTRIVFAGWDAQPGQTVELPALFLARELALERFPPGTRFAIMDRNKLTGQGVFLSHGSNVAMY